MATLCFSIVQVKHSLSLLTEFRPRRGADITEIINTSGNKRRKHTKQRPPGGLTSRNGAHIRTDTVVSKGDGLCATLTDEAWTVVSSGGLCSTLNVVFLKGEGRQEDLLTDIVGAKWDQRAGGGLHCLNLCGWWIAEDSADADCVICRVSPSQREREEGGRQEGVTAKVEGHDPIPLDLHEVRAIHVRWAKAQAVTGV